MRIGHSQFQMSLAMRYDPNAVIHSYTKNADIEDRSEKAPSLRTEIPREFIRRYIKPTDVVLDAGGGTGINAMMMVELCRSVTLLDLTPKMLELARGRISIEQGSTACVDCDAI